MSDSLLEAVRIVARLAGDVAFTHYRTAIRVESKGDGSPVTIADRSAEEAARVWIAKHFPRDGVLGEELGAVEGTSGRRWLLDPVDGTKSFVRGVPLWGTLVAVAEGDRVLAGCAYFPAVDEIIAAAPGEGCWWNGGRAAVSAVSALTGATALVTDDRTFSSVAQRDAWDALSTKVGIARSWGDCFGYLLVATGRAEVMVDPIINPWDAACFLPIVEEAGGVFTSLSGERTAFGGHAIATNKALAAAAREFFRTPSV